MARKKPSPESARPNRSPSWVIYARVDPDLEAAVEAYIQAQDYPPALARVIERALKLLLKEAGFWPPPMEAS